MNTLIILLIIFYLVFSKLARTSGRTPFPPRPGENDFPVPVELPDYNEEDDAPLSGPWNRDSGAAAPERKEDAQVTDPVFVEPRPQKNGELRQRTGEAQYQPDPANCRQQAEQPIPLQLRKQAEPEEFACQQGHWLPGQGHEHRKSRRRKNPLAAAICSKHELVGSILVGEIIATRGGFRGKRK